MDLPDYSEEEYGHMEEWEKIYCDLCYATAMKTKETHNINTGDVTEEDYEDAFFMFFSRMKYAVKWMDVAKRIETLWGRDYSKKKYDVSVKEYGQNLYSAIRTLVEVFEEPEEITIEHEYEDKDGNKHPVAVKDYMVVWK
jgi:hypothetical protein